MYGPKYTVRNLYFWRVVLALFLASFFILASLYVVHPLMPVFVKEFNVATSVSGLSLSLTVIGLIIGLLVNGFLSDRTGRTQFILLSLLGTVILFLIIPAFDSFLSLLILRFIQGFALSGLLVAALAYIGEEISPKSSGFATALYIASNAVGGMFGRFLTAYLVDSYSWETTFYLWAVIGFIIFLLTIFALPKSRFFKSIHTPFKEDLKGYIQHLKNPELLILFGLGIILQLSFTGIWTYIPFHLQNEPFSFSLQEISYLYITYGLGIIGSSVAGVLINTFSLEKIRIIAIFIMSTGIFITIVPSIPLIATGLGLMCLGFFIAHSLTAISVNVIATHHKGTAASLYLAAYYLGVSMGSFVLTPVWEHIGWIGLTCIGGILPISYIVLYRIRIKKIAQKPIIYNYRS